METETLQTKKLNLIEANKKLTELGLNQAAIAEKLDVSRESVSQWFKNENFPKPKSLLGLSRILGLPFEKLVSIELNENEPIIAFRKKARHDITSEYISSAKDNGLLLEGLVNHLHYDDTYQTPTLVNPKNDYEYIQRVAHKIRHQMKIKSGEKINFGDLINFFNTLHATLIPVFLGHKEAHENALHIYLPKTKSTWIYLNLDSNVCDFNFWMAHELGHAIAPKLKDNEGEDFADSFAGAILVDQEKAKKEYLVLRKLGGNAGRQINHIKKIASNLCVSPYTIYVEINKFAAHSGSPKIQLDSIHGATKNFEKTVPTISQIIFKDKIPTSIDYVNIVTKQFKTPFFKALKEHLLTAKKGANLIHRILYLPLVDAQQFYEEICQWNPVGS